MNEHNKIRVANVQKRIKSSQVIFDGQGDFCFEYHCTDNLNTVLRKMCKQILVSSTGNPVKSFRFNTDSTTLTVTLQDNTEFETSPLDTVFAKVNHNHYASDIVDFDNAALNAIQDKLQYTHLQNSSSALWVIPHNLGYKPAGVYVEDSAGEQWLANINHIDENNMEIDFGGLSFSGKAFLS
jgi:hypothetical protein